MKPRLFALARVLGGLVDARTTATLAALAAIWYGVESGRGAFWIVGAVVYLTIFAFALPEVFRSRRSE